MNAQSFVDELGKSAPNLDILVSDGLTHDEAEGLRECFFAKKRNAVADDDDNPVFSLVSNYDMSKVEVGMVYFDSKLSNGNGRSYFGRIEGDSLAVEQDTKAVLAEEFPHKGHTIAYCAADQSHFLDALACAAAWFGKALEDSELGEDEGKKRLLPFDALLSQVGRSMLAFMNCY